MEKNDTDRPERIVQWLVEPMLQGVYAIVSFSLVLVYLVAFFIFVPNSGLTVTRGVGERLVVTRVAGPALEAGFQLDDTIVAIDGRQVFFQQGPVNRPGLRKGDIVTYEVERQGERLTLTSELDSPLEDLGTYGPRYAIHFMALIFWAIGGMLCLFSGRQDLRSRLVGLCWLLAGLAAAAGGAGIVSHFWGASTVSNLSLGFLGFTLIAAHLYFPRRSFSQRLRKTVIILFFGAALVVAAFRFFESVARPEIRVASRLGTWLFLLGVLASITLLAKNRWETASPDTRRQTGIILWGMILSFSPLIVFSLLPDLILGQAYIDSSYTFLFLILLPLAYAYTIHQRTFLKIDLIVNRIVVFFVLLLLVLTVAIGVLGLVTLVFDLSPQVPLWGGAVAALLVLPSASMQKRVQQQVNRVLYGTHYDFSTVTSSLSHNLVRALSRKRLVELLTDHVAEEMGIVRTALLLLKDDRLVLEGPEESVFAVPTHDEACRFLLEAGVPVRSGNFMGLLSTAAAENWRRFSWAELFVPMVLEQKLYGILILGERVASEIFSEQDLHILSVVAQQGALAAANVRLVEELRGLTQRMVRADEEQRKKLARDLHDTVLQNLFFVKQGLLRENQPERVQYLDDVIATLRRTIRAQRTSLLDHGLALALGDLVEEFQKLPGEKVPIAWIQDAGVESVRLTDEQATTFYRITQEALSNARKHARAQKITVELKLVNGARGDKMKLVVKDDGVGMEDGKKEREGHYGILGMGERALMIGADLDISSVRNQGTTVRLELDL